MKQIVSIALITAIITATLVVLFKDQWSPPPESFQLSQVALTNLSDLPTTIQPGRAGYVVFYSDLESCSACVRKLAYMDKVAEAYPDVGFYSIMRSASYKDPFVAQMREHLVPGEYLIDDKQIIANQLGLSDHSHLIFLDRYERLIAIMALTVDHDGILKQYHRYIAEM